MALNEQETTPKIVKVLDNKTQSNLPASNYYRGILLTREGLKSLLEETFTQYGIADQIKRAEAVITCESSWNIYANNEISFGAAQFTKATWDDFGSGDIFNPQTQFQVMAKLWKRGEQGRWDCFTGKR